MAAALITKAGEANALGALRAMRDAAVSALGALEREDLEAVRVSLEAGGRAFDALGEWLNMNDPPSACLRQEAEIVKTLQALALQRAEAARDRTAREIELLGEVGRGLRGYKPNEASAAVDWES